MKPNACSWRPAILSYRVFYFTVYSLGLRLGEGLRLRVSDIDAGYRRVYIRNAKGNKNRLVPLPNVTLNLLHRFWRAHCNPALLSPNCQGDLKVTHSGATPLDRAGIWTALHKVYTFLWN
uniref:Phage integrase family protein n=1 Tax=Candidatus Kentrum sp. LFY TaxID=2126342 RepID=A0A450X2I1_9GAMM|nr:MAG: Phage integrase family protein [Candidatus Kentron sp. LFY]